MHLSQSIKSKSRSVSVGISWVVGLRHPSRPFGTLRGMMNPVGNNGGTASAAGFSLVETCVAISIVAFGFVALLGLIPAGLNNFRSAMDTQTATEIFQRVVADAQETDFDTLISCAVEKGGVSTQFYRLPLRYFDDQGNEVKVANPDVPTAAELKWIVYVVRVRGSLPGNPDPSKHTVDYFTSLPGAVVPRFNPRDLTYLLVQVATTRGLRDVKSLVDVTTFMVNPTTAATAGMSLRNYTAVVARNKGTI